MARNRVFDGFSPQHSINLTIIETENFPQLFIRDFSIGKGWEKIRKFLIRNNGFQKNQFGKMNQNQFWQESLQEIFLLNQESCY